MIKDLVQRNRSYRRFDQEIPVAETTLRDLVDLARLCASAANLQPLKYLLSCEPERNDVIFRHLPIWAGYLSDWPGPGEGERPTAYIVILGDTTIAQSFDHDCGIAAQTILLGAVERGLGGCLFSSVQREGLRKALNIPDTCRILLVMALGTPAETVVTDPVNSNGDVTYWRDEAGVHHVPKRALDDIIIGLSAE